MSMEAFFRAYLVAFLYWNELTLGCLAVLMLHHLAGGRWGFPIRRLLAAGARTVPLMAALFFPLIFGISFLYPWAGGRARSETGPSIGGENCCWSRAST